jgi:FkbM family methyltransferase
MTSRGREGSLCSIYSAVYQAGELAADRRIPNLLHFSVPNAITERQAAAIETARRLHPDWEVKIWNDATPIENARLAKYRDRARSGAQRADLIRLDAVHVYGGVYLDADMMVLKPFDEIVRYYDFFIGCEDGENLTNALFAATPRHPAIGAIISFLEENEPDWSLAPNETTGPVLFARLLGWRPEVNILPRETFYPYNWNEVGPRRPHRWSYTEHLWEDSWKEQVAEEPERKLSIATSAKVLTKRAIRSVLIPGISALRRAKAVADPAPPEDFLSTHPARGYGCTDEIVVRTAHGQKIVADGRDLSVTPDLVIHGFHEWPEEAFVRRTLRGGDWFVDVGANIGVFTILAASLCGPLGRVLAFEPNPPVRRLLEKSAVMNWFHDRIKIFETALGEAEGEVVLSYYPHRLGDAQVQTQQKGAMPFQLTGKFLERKQIEVPIRPLDDIIPVDLPIKILKIDAEGHEPEVLGGSKRLLAARCFDFIILEASYELFSDNWKEMLASLKMLADLGYAPGTLNANGILISHPSVGEALKARGRGKTLVFSGG